MCGKELVAKRMLDSPFRRSRLYGVVSLDEILLLRVYEARHRQRRRICRSHCGSRQGDLESGKDCHKHQYLAQWGYFDSIRIGRLLLDIVISQTRD